MKDPGAGAGEAGSPDADVLVVNTGSSTLKLHVLDADERVVADALVDPWDGTGVDALRDFVDDAPPVGAVGHRVVHGGPDLTEATLVDDDVVAAIESLGPLAPLHQPRSVAGLRAARHVLADVPHVACFDTSHHAGLTPAVRTYALPRDWRERWPVRRYGFHGLSHAHAARRAARMARPVEGPLRVVSCHLGSGASLCASYGGRSVDTTMGFTPLEGLVMQTRSGSIDPGLVVWLCTEAGLDPSEVGERLEHDAGLAGLAGGSGDMREVLEQRAAGDDDADLAVDVYLHHLVREVAAMTASLRGLDVLVFTAGVGEHAADVRAEAAARLAHLDVAVDPAGNARAVGGGDHDITAEGSGVRVLVVEAREDLEITRQTRAVLAATA